MTMATDSNLTEIILPTTLKQFVDIAWRSGEFMNEFLSEKLLEKEVLITDWSVISSRDDKNIKYERTISSQHPLPLSLPWLPLFVQSSNIQSLVYDSNCCSLHITEISTIKGLPFVDPYIITEWVVNEMPSGHCNVRISLRFKYDKQSWLQGMVESQSRTELLKFFDMWEINFCDQVLSFNFKDEEKDARGLNKLAHLFSPGVKHPIENAYRSDTYPDQLRDSHSDKHSTEGIPVLLCPKSNAGFECDVQTGLIDDKQPLLKAFKHHDDDDECDDDDEHHACLSEKSEGFPISINRCLNRLQDYLILKVYVAIIINLYAKIDVAALHGIEVNNWLRSILDQTASISLILCLMLIIEIAVQIAPTLNSFLLSYDVNEFIDIVDDLRAGNPPCNWPAAILLDAALGMIPPAQPAHFVSIGTQTDIVCSDNIIYSEIVHEQSVFIVNEANVSTPYEIEIGEMNTEKVSSIDSESFHASDTWRDSSDMILPSDGEDVILLTATSNRPLPVLIIA